VCSCVWIYTCFGEIYCLHLLSRPRRWMQHVVPKHLTPKDHRPNHLVYIYMTFSLKRDSNVYTHINLAPFSCVHRKQQDGSTTSPMGSKIFAKKNNKLKSRLSPNTVFVSKPKAPPRCLGSAPVQPNSSGHVRLRLETFTVTSETAEAPWGRTPHSTSGTFRQRVRPAAQGLGTRGGTCNISRVFLCCACHQIGMWVVKLRKMRLAEHVAYMGKNIYTIKSYIVRSLEGCANKCKKNCKILSLSKIRRYLLPLC